jgi:hypothetical protein
MKQTKLVQSKMVVHNPCSPMCLEYLSTCSEQNGCAQPMFYNVPGIPLILIMNARSRHFNRRAHIWANTELRVTKITLRDKQL